VKPGILALIILLFGSALRADPYSDMSVDLSAAPAAAPSFELPDLKGEEVSLAALSGKVVLLNFWATWCTPCRAEMPGMERLWRQYHDRGLAIVAISVDEGGEKRIASFVRRLNLSYPILLDPQSETADRYEVSGLPSSFLIDGEGRLIGRMVGGREWDKPEAVSLIEKLLGL
jgi:peroxiredoxin